MSPASPCFARMKCITTAIAVNNDLRYFQDYVSELFFFSVLIVCWINDLIKYLNYVLTLSISHSLSPCSVISEKRQTIYVTILCTKQFLYITYFDETLCFYYWSTFIISLFCLKTIKFDSEV